LTSWKQANSYPFYFKTYNSASQSPCDVCNNSNINILARWTPFVCGILGILGLWLKSPIYLWLLGLLTLVGAVSNRSIYDYFYQLILRPLLSLWNMPSGTNSHFPEGVITGRWRKSYLIDSINNREFDCYNIKVKKNGCASCVKSPSTNYLEI
jgi:hypothetical protein